MRSLALAVTIGLLPAALAAQQATDSTRGRARAEVKTAVRAESRPATPQGGTQGITQAALHAAEQAKANANENSAVARGVAAADGGATAEIPASYSAEARARLSTTLRTAREGNLPEEPIRDRIAEGQAKGAAEAHVVAAAEKVALRLEAAQRALRRGGRERPTSNEVTRGAQAMERGVTEAQLEALVRHAPADRSLETAFDVLSRLADRGLPVDQALAQVQAKLEARASDAAIRGLVGAGVGGRGMAAGPALDGGATMAGQATGAVRGAVEGTVGATVSGAARGRIRP